MSADKPIPLSRQLLISAATSSLTSSSLKRRIQAYESALAQHGELAALQERVGEDRTEADFLHAAEKVYAKERREIDQYDSEEEVSDDVAAEI